MVGWHHHFNGHELGRTARHVEGQGSLACCSPWDHEGSDTTWRLNNKISQLRAWTHSLLTWHRTGIQRTNEGRSHGQRMNRWCWLKATEPVNESARSRHIPSSPDASVQPPPWPSWRSSPSGASPPLPDAFSQPPGAAGTGGGRQQGGHRTICVAVTVLPASLTPPHPLQVPGLGMILPNNLAERN